jgi:prepilin-type N-terminal cleavage/methylation domain-containing protein
MPMTSARRPVQGSTHPWKYGRRDGFTLLEALVALIMIGILAILLSRGVVMQARAAADVSARTAARRELRAAAAPLIGELRHAITERDAALSLHGTELRVRTVIADGAACMAGDGRVALLGQPASAPLAGWSAMPDARDALLLLHPEQPGESCDHWSETGVVGASHLTTLPFPCEPSTGANALVIVPGSPAGLVALDTTLAQVARRVVWRLTNSAGGWYLSRARCDAESGIATPACDPTQPVAGPFLSPGAGGLRLRPLSAAGTPLDAANQHEARAVEIQLVAPVSHTRPGAAPHESLHVVVPLPRACS